MRGFSVYVENKVSSDSPYFVSDTQVRAALGVLAENLEINVNSERSPDLKALETARYFIGSGFDPARLNRHGAALRLVHCTSAGVEMYMPLDWLPSNAALTNSSGVHAEKGGAFGAMIVLMLCEEVPRHIQNQRLRRWDNRLSGSIGRKTIAICGMGALGSAIATRLRPFGPRIIGISRTGAANEVADEMVAVADLKGVLPQADCLVLSCPLTTETRGVIGKAEIALMKRGSSIFNVARGPVLDNRALCEALASGHLSGAALDVFDQEPLPAASPLWDAPNLVIFPHISCDDSECYIDRCLSVFAENVRRDFAGEAFVNRVSREIGY